MRFFVYVAICCICACRNNTSGFSKANVVMHTIVWEEQHNANSCKPVRAASQTQCSSRTSPLNRLFCVRFRLSRWPTLL